jgi:hypothetical protein
VKALNEQEPSTMILPAPYAEVKPAPVASVFPLALSVERDADDYRPSVGPDYIPTSEEEAEAAELLNNEIEPDWDSLAEDALALDIVCSGYPWL